MTHPHSLELQERAKASALLWRLSPRQLHDRLWASRSVQVVRAGEARTLPDDPDIELFLLVPADGLVFFEMREALQILAWRRPQLLTLRVHDDIPIVVRERVESDGLVTWVESARAPVGQRVMRAALTADPDVARFWRQRPDTGRHRRMLRAICAPQRRAVRAIRGMVAGGNSTRDELDFVTRLSISIGDLQQAIGGEREICQAKK
jgi:hypothetical protein